MNTTPQAASVPELPPLGPLPAARTFWPRVPADGYVYSAQQVEEIRSEAYKAGARAALDAQKAGQEPPKAAVSMPQYWSVDVNCDGVNLVSIGPDWLSGSRALEEQDERTILGAAQHLLSFIGYGLPQTSFDPDAEAAAPSGELLKSFLESAKQAGITHLTLPPEAAAPALVGWQPIETAPDNMTECVVVRWINSDGEECRDLDHKEDGCWVGWHEHAEHVQMIGGHGVSYTPPYAQWLQLPPASGEATSSQPEKGNQP